MSTQRQRWVSLAVNGSPSGLPPRSACGMFALSGAPEGCGLLPRLSGTILAYNPGHCSSTTKAPKHQGGAAQKRCPPLDGASRNFVHRTVLAWPVEVLVPMRTVVPWCLSRKSPHPSPHAGGGPGWGRVFIRRGGQAGSCPLRGKSLTRCVVGRALVALRPRRGTSNRGGRGDGTSGQVIVALLAQAIEGGG
jgi:hypothetical protein